MKDQTSTPMEETIDHEGKRGDTEKSPYSFTDPFDAGVSPEYRDYRERGGR